ncbi:hypothetical protein MOUN0_I00474 [Monosporozyma unispora]
MEYSMTTRIYTSEYIPLRHLHSVKIIGIQGPEGTFSLWGENEGNISDDFVPADFTVAFRIYVRQNNDPCLVSMSSFQVQYEYNRSAGWISNGCSRVTVFALLVGCGGDNWRNPHSDFPFCIWP